MVNILSTILSGLILGYGSNYVWKCLNDSHRGIKNLMFHISAIITGIVTYFNYYYTNGYVKIILITIMSTIIIRSMYVKTLKDSIISALFFQIVMFISEFLFLLLLLTFFRTNTDFFLEASRGALITNFFIMTLTVLLIRVPLFKKLYKFLLRSVEKINIPFFIFLACILIISVNLIFAIPYYTIPNYAIVVINTLLIVIYSFILFKFVQEKNRYITIHDKYSMTESSLKELQSNINRLMAVNHENKNQLKTIRTMVANKDKNVLKNLDAMIEQKVKDNKELKAQTSVIANTMLGALVYSKMLTMKDNNIISDLHIEKNISKVDFINLGEKTNVDVCKIIGVYLDNAIEATLEAPDKIVNIQIYIEENEMIICVANTFVGSVDLEAINQYGFTTKEDGHGYGLPLVKTIIKENDNLSSETEIIDNIFMQKLKIKM